MVAAVRNGESQRSVATRFGVTLSTVQRWVSQAEGQRLDRVDWSGARGGRREGQATASDVEDLILSLRKELREASDLGEFGAAAIHRELMARKKTRALKTVPSLRTIGRILERRGALDGQRRVRRPPPPKGWYLPDVAARQSELDSVDIVEGLVIRGGLQVEVLNVISLHGGLCESWVSETATSKFTVEKLLSHWLIHGLPTYAQFDNDTIFQGAHQWPDSFGRVIRLCLQLKVIPVFAPPRETGFQAMIEAYNGRWQDKVWQRFVYTSHADLQAQSDRFTAAVRLRATPRIETAPKRRPFPKRWKLDFKKPLEGQVVFIRRTSATGEVEVLRRKYMVNAKWCNRLIRCVVDLTQGRLRFYRLRRRAPTQQPLLKDRVYNVPTKRFQD